MKRLAVLATAGLLLVGCHYDLLDAEKPGNTPTAPVWPLDTIELTPRVPATSSVRLQPTTTSGEAGVQVGGGQSPRLDVSWARCPRAMRWAVREGWPVGDLARLDQIVYRESRCIPRVRSTTRDTGLTQINDIHLGWLAAEGISAADLYRPRPNLRAARLLFLKAQRMFGCGWQPWRGTC